MKYVFYLFVLLLIGCSSVPLTGRKQLSLVSNDEVLSLSSQQYGEFMSSAPISTDKQNMALVQKVGRNIANAVEKFMSDNGYSDLIKDYAWEFNLVKSSDVNAFCMPGGKIVVYEGILPYTRNETGLAVVLGHEVAHAVAKHANERMSQQLISQLGGVGLGVALANKPEETQALAMAAYGLGTQYGVLLPYSRKHELEADHLGLIFMAMAGYDPREAPSFWTRMSQQGTGTPEFLSTHPSDDTRTKELEKEMTEALKYYKTGNTPSGKNLKTSSKWTF